MATAFSIPRVPKWTAEEITASHAPRIAEAARLGYHAHVCPQCPSAFVCPREHLTDLAPRCPRTTCGALMVTR